MLNATITRYYNSIALHLFLIRYSSVEQINEYLDFHRSIDGIDFKRKHFRLTDILSLSLSSSEQGLGTRLPDCKLVNGSGRFGNRK